jgi:hypothetical protein
MNGPVGFLVSTVIIQYLRIGFVFYRNEKGIDVVDEWLVVTVYLGGPRFDSGLGNSLSGVVYLRPIMQALVNRPTLKHVIAAFIYVLSISSLVIIVLPFPPV